MEENTEAKRQSKRGEIDSILQKVENYANEGRVGAEELNVVLLQERTPEAKTGEGMSSLSEDERSLGWFDNTIKKLRRVSHNLEKTCGHLSLLHKEISEK